MKVDISRAYANANARRVVYVSLPKMIDPESQFCGLLKKAMSGTRDGTQNWNECLAEVLEMQLASFKFERQGLPLRLLI